jgi:hypothetical protein
MSGPSNWLPMNKMQPAEASQFRPIQPALPSQSLALSTAHSEEQVGMKRNRTKRAWYKKKKTAFETYSKPK